MFSATSTDGGHLGALVVRQLSLAAKFDAVGHCTLGAVQRARYLTLETIAPLREDEAASESFQRHPKLGLRQAGHKLRIGPGVAIVVSWNFGTGGHTR